MIGDKVLLRVALVTVGLLAAATAGATTEGLDFFETKIRPVLVSNCYACHSAEAKTRMGGLSLDTREGIRMGGQRGHAVVPMDVESSLIVDALRYEGALRMPPTGKLPEDVATDFEQWIRMGAPDPRETEAKTVESSIDLEEGRKFWAFQPPVKGQPPAVRNRSWPQGAIDRYVLAELESNRLRPVEDAAKSDLLRRVTFDLTGLPPTPEELRAFLIDKSDGAYGKVVNRLLESDRFGERWGRHWLDVVRYADTSGRTRNLPFPVAWRYRDYVIRSFNEDKPYDEFVQEQIAGDLLPHGDPRERVENQIATGFLAIGAHDLNEQDAKQFEMDVADEMINATSRSILALSVGCARCHDHKFDPIPTTDYYALAGIFRSSELRSGLRRRPRFNAGYFRVHKLVELDGVPPYAAADADEIRAERERLTAELKAAEEERNRNKAREHARALAKLPMPENLAMGVVEAGKPVATRVNLGGDPHTLGQPVDRGFVQALFPDGADLPEIGNGESGRLALAKWLTRPDNPLTARVMANRIWHHMMGKGIVGTVDNFGATGQHPTNQPLLDYLAVRFVEEGWSVKSLVREIALSRTYRLSSQFDEQNFTRDPDNDRQWRANVRRLEAEAVRDSVLLVSGELESALPTPAPVHGFDRYQQLNANNKQLKPWEIEEPYRSVYVPVIRNHANRMFEAFDFPDPSETRGVRDITTGPIQALFMMNNHFVRTHSGIAAERLMATSSGDRERIRYAFQQVLSRDPRPAELKQSLQRVRDVRRAAHQAQPSAEDQQAAREWLGSALEIALARPPADAELTTAMDFLTGLNQGAYSSAAAAASTLVDEEWRLREDTARRLIEVVLDRDLDEQGWLKAKRPLRRWVKGESESVGEADPALMAVSASPDHESWTRLYHALFNTAEFRFRH